MNAQNEKLLSRARKLFAEVADVGLLGEKHKRNFIARCKRLAAQLSPYESADAQSIMYLDHIDIRLTGAYPENCLGLRYKKKEN